MSRADAKHIVHLLHDYPAKAHARLVTSEDKSVLLEAVVYKSNRALDGWEGPKYK